LKKILYALIGGLIFGFIDSVKRNQSGKLIVIVVRGLFSTSLVAGGFIARSVTDGESIRSSALSGNKIILSFFVGYFIGAILSRLLY